MLEFILTSIIVELTPGPNMAYLATVAITYGKRRALMTVAGVALGLAIVGAAAALGLATLVEQTPVAYQALRYGGALYLLWLAFDAWRAPAETGADAVEDFASFRRGLITNLLNPKAAVFYVAILPTFVDPARGGVLWQTLTLAAIYVAIATAIHALIVLLAGQVRPLLRRQAGERLVRRALALTLAGVAVWFLFATKR